SGSRGRDVMSAFDGWGPKMLQAPSLFGTFRSLAVIVPSNVGAGPAWSSIVRQAVATLLVSDGGRGSRHTAQNASGAATVSPSLTASMSSFTTSPSSPSGGVPRTARTRVPVTNEIGEPRSGLQPASPPDTTTSKTATNDADARVLIRTPSS